jgi:hypothetical protein
MTLQNRVTPFGEIVAVPARGTLMGNRGNLHGNDQHLLRTQAGRKDWVTCRLDFRGIRRRVMAPGKYTELFFLDEATALAAGHRPCNVCRSARFKAFKQAWAVGVLGQPGAQLRVKDIDPVLHADRLISKGVQRRFSSRLGELPDGVVLRLPDEVGVARLKWQAHLHRWSPSGYEDRRVDENVTVTVLTPACTVKVLEARYLPEIHPSLAGQEPCIHPDNNSGKSS